MKTQAATLIVGLVIIFLGISASMTHGDEKSPDHTIEIARDGDGLRYVERTANGARPQTVVVGEIVRWRNADTVDHTVVCETKADGKRLFETATIKPGEYKDMQIDVKLYDKAGGKRAGTVAVTYASRGDLGVKGSLTLISAAKR